MKIFGKVGLLGLMGMSISFNAFAGRVHNIAAGEIQRVYRGHLVRKDRAGGASAVLGGSPASIPAVVAQDKQDQEVQTEPLQFRTTCDYCADREVNTVFAPCGHASACWECSAKVGRRCPTCKRDISNILPLYLQGTQEVVERFNRVEPRAAVDHVVAQGGGAPPAVIEDPAVQVHPVAQPMAPQNAQTLTTRTGHIFTNRNDLAPGAWEDPSGMVWFDAEPREETQFNAEAACRAKGLVLPSQDDLKRLRSYMGASVDSSQGFTPQILPNLSGRWFWSSSVHAMYAYSHFAFVGGSGVVGGDNRFYLNAFRCVSPAAAR